MHRVEEIPNTPNKFGPGRTGYTDPDPITPDTGTPLEPGTADSWQEEIARVVEKREPLTGVTLKTKATDASEALAGRFGYEQVDLALTLLRLSGLSFGAEAWSPPRTVPNVEYATGVGLNQPIVAGGSVYINGLQREFDQRQIDAIENAFPGTSPHAFLQFRDTYVSTDNIGETPSLSFTAVSNGDPAPAPPAGETFFMKVVTNLTDVVSVTPAPARTVMSRSFDLRDAVFSNVDPITGDGSPTIPFRVEGDSSVTHNADLQGGGTVATVRCRSTITSAPSLLVQGASGGADQFQEAMQVIATGLGRGVEIDVTTTRHSALRILAFDDPLLTAFEPHIILEPYDELHPGFQPAGGLWSFDDAGKISLYFRGVTQERVHSSPSGNKIDQDLDTLFTPVDPFVYETWLDSGLINSLASDVWEFPFEGSMQGIDGGINDGSFFRFYLKIERSINGGGFVTVYEEPVLAVTSGAFNFHAMIYRKEIRASLADETVQYRAQVKIEAGDPGTSYRIRRGALNFTSGRTFF